MSQKVGFVRRCFVASDRVRVIYRGTEPQSVTAFLNHPHQRLSASGTPDLAIRAEQDWSESRS